MALLDGMVLYYDLDAPGAVVATWTLTAEERKALYRDGERLSYPFIEADEPIVVDG